MTFRIFVAVVLLNITWASAALVRTKQSGPWSQPDTWEMRRIPEAGDVVLIRPRHLVVYDVKSEVVVRAVHIAGVLSFSREHDTLLCAGLIRIAAGEECLEQGFDCHARPPESVQEEERPALEIGTVDSPIPIERTAVLRLTYIPGMDQQSFPALVCCGGRMELHGAPLEKTWMKLGYQTPITGHRTIRLPRIPTQWRTGDRLLFTGTGQTSPTNDVTDDGRYVGHRLMREVSRSEVRTMRSAKEWGFASDFQLVTLDAPLQFNHDVLERWQAEVANLSRNVVVESADPAGVRGHTMYHRGSTGGLSYVEFRHLGKEGVFGRYPIHFHLVGDTMRGTSVTGCSIWDSSNRALVVHGSHYLVVRDNVAFDIKGHAYYLEDGTETRNILDRNLVCLVHQASPLPEQTLTFDMNTGAGFWWANSLNVFTRNVAAECDHDGFRLEAVRTKEGDPRTAVRQPDGSYQTRDLRTVPFIRFEANEAHRMRFFGLNLNGLTTAPESAEKVLKELGAAEDAEGIGPDIRHAFKIRDFRCWDAHWVFHNGSWNTQIDGLDMFRSVHGLWRPMAMGQHWRGMRVEMVDSTIIFPRWSSSELAPAEARQYGTEIEQIDDLPPSAIITRVQRLDSGQLRVQGWVAEDETTTSVTVNGQRATSTRGDFVEWEAIINVPVDGKVTAVAADRAGNIDRAPHILNLSSLLVVK